MFHPEFAFDVPTGSSLLAEVGIDPSTVREIAEDERAMHCPERNAVYPEHRFANLVPEQPLVQDLHEAGPDEPRGPAPARRPAARRWRRA